MSLFAPVEPHPIFLFANLDDSSIRHRVQLVLRDNHGHQGALELDLNVVPPLPDGKTWDEFQRAYASNDTGDAQHQAFGRHLFAALSGNAAMRETWQGIHSASSAAGQPLALTAIFGPGTERLARLPLELLHDDAGFLFARPDSAVRRCFAHAAARVRIPAVTPTAVRLGLPAGRGRSVRSRAARGSVARAVRRPSDRVPAGESRWHRPSARHHALPLRAYLGARFPR
ncbi:MAG: hypothetical protein RKO66_15370 [Candidatus Contendobacter sp.]|nr:hypothetical protein [Candidatus Contendobacter sp.]